MSWVSGLCSVTFRQLSPEEIVRLSVSAGLKAVEWGSDVHAPAGDTRRAGKIAALCRDAGLGCPTLGSYARATNSERSQPFEPLLDTAEALGANTIRVWAGETGFAETSEAGRRAVAQSIHAYAQAADARGMRVALEYHPNTLTDCREGALWLLKEAAHPALYTYWQPVPDQPAAECRADLEALGDRLAHLHVFYWKGERVRHPLAEGAGYWAQFLKGFPVPGNGQKIGHAFLEFVPEDDPSCLASEAAALAALIGQAEYQHELTQ